MTVTGNVKKELANLEIVAMTEKLFEKYVMKNKTFDEISKKKNHKHDLVTS